MSSVMMQSYGWNLQRLQHSRNNNNNNNAISFGGSLKAVGAVQRYGNCCESRFLLIELDANYGMVWYGMVNVDLYSAIITKVSNALKL